MSSSEQLNNIRQLGVYTYRYKRSVAKMMKCETHRTQVGFLAQQVRDVLPAAVKEVVSVCDLWGEERVISVRGE